MAEESSLMQSPEIQQLPLKDLHLPPAPGFWPLAPGWWLLAIIVVLLAIWGIHKLIKVRRRQQQWQRLKQLWQVTRDNYQHHQDKTRLARELSQLLRRYVRHYQVDSEAVGLTGEAWITYLNRDLKQPVFNTFEDTLSDNLYQRQNDYPAEQLLQAVHDYLRYHSLKGSSLKMPRSPS